MRNPPSPLGQWLSYGSVCCLPGAGPVDQWTWRNPVPTGNQLSAIAYGNNQFVAVGDYGPIVISPDGIAWTRRAAGTEHRFHAIACGNDTFVAFGYSGTILQPDALLSMQSTSELVALLSSGAAQWTLTGRAGQTHPIRAWSNLIDWVTLANLTLTNPSGQFTDAPALTSSAPSAWV